ncbi:MAG: threonine/serine dehydratase [Actinobacteria bacterium]|nr:threonine/serine dehydratase [Actinomycetota bacterium]
MDLEVTRSDIESASDRIAPFTRLTPVVELGDVFEAGYRLSLKLDHLQPTGSFKVRGAFSVLSSRDIPVSGVTAASGGNFGIAIAYACSKLGYSATVFVAETSPAEKIDRIGEYGADVRVIPGYYHQALAACEDWTVESGAFQAHAYDQPEVVAGQGTAGREIMRQIEDVDSVLVAVGGGGLIGGVASWLRDEVRVVATEPEGCASLHAARKAGGPTVVEVGGVAASSLGAESIGEYAWHANRWIDDSVLVTDAEIIAAQTWLWQNARLAVEPAAATTVAALMSGVYRPEPGEHVVALISGANVNPGTLG